MLVFTLCDGCKPAFFLASWTGHGIGLIFDDQMYNPAGITKKFPVPNLGTVNTDPGLGCL